ncbi:DNA polymerase I [Ruthenibacterium sp. CLA-JM-H11]|uniref:DNA polymerase I n=1 Tax=Ruthenibacterium intestinale TaxID=3133163 RepID=A0ABV1GD86_9FIRM
MKLLVLDGNSIVNRAFYGIKLLTTKDGRYTNALVGFMNILLKLQAEQNPDEVAIAFDLKAPTFRHKLYDGYKAQRKGMPQELADQMPVLKELLADLGYQMVTCEGYEADDILGTLSAACEARGDECVLATGDRDSLQLIGPHTTVLLASTQMGKSVTIPMDEAAVQEKYGVSPRQLIDVKSLMGDTSDNIPGVTGVGEKTALALIQAFGSLAGVYENLDDARIKRGVREKLVRDKAQAEMSLTLARIDRAAPVPTEPGAYQRTQPDAAAASALLTGLEMYSTLEKLHLEAASAPQQTAAPLPQTALQPLTQAPEIGRVFLYFQQDAPIIVYSENVYTSSIDSEAFLDLLANDRVQKECFDAKAFYRAALRAQRHARGIVFDAKLAAYLLNPSASEYSIAHLAGAYGASPSFACADAPDAPCLEPLCDALRSACAQQGMESLLNDMELPLAEVLAEMEHTGIQVDKEGIEAFGRELQAALTAELAAIYEEVGYEFNVNSPKQLGKALFEDLGLPTRKKTKSGYSTSADVLESLRRYTPVIDHILQYRTYQKLNSTYVEGLLKVIGPDGRIHSTFNQTETRTGRISSNEPNLQNIPVRTELGSRFRRYFTACEGCTLLDADYSQIELRIMAHISGDEHMRQAFADGEDIHRATAARIYGVSPQDVTPAMRSSVKAINFGIIYGKGAYSLSQDLGISVKEAEAFIQTYLGAYPKVKEYMDATVAFGKEHGYVATLYGRRRVLPELASSNFNVRAQGERMALNTPIQGTAADVIKLAMVRVFRRLRDEGLRARLILQVHDELIVECPLEEQKQAARILGEEMRKAADLSVPLVADVNSGDTWYAAKG